MTNEVIEVLRAAVGANHCPTRGAIKDRFLRNRMVKTPQGVRDLWSQAVDKKGGQGADLYTAARNLVKEYSTRH